MHLFIPLFILFSTLTYFDLKNEYEYIYEYFQWNHFINRDSCTHIPKFEKCILIKIRVWEANFPWKDGVKNCWSMEKCCKQVMEWNQPSMYLLLSWFSISIIPWSYWAFKLACWWKLKETSFSSIEITIFEFETFWISL